MTTPDPNRIGGLEWARRTRGTLTSSERRQLLVAIAVTQVANAVGRAKLALVVCDLRHMSAEVAAAAASPPSRAPASRQACR